MRIIRLALHSDIDELRLVNPLLSRDLITNRLKQQKQNEAEYLVLDDGAHIVGQVFLKWNGKSTHPEYPDIENIYVKGSERGKGYGTLLIRECERRAKEKGFKKIGLSVNHEKNCPEQILYRKLGYVHDGKPSYADGIYNGVKETVIDMEKILI